MKLMIASDLHGSATACKKLLDTFTASGAEHLILLGDLLYHGPRNDLPEGYDPKAVISMLNPFADSLFCVRGNCDSEVDQMVLNFPMMSETALLLVDGRTWFACHGHRKGANPMEGELPNLPMGSVVLSGHTHIPMLEQSPRGVLLVNPGSIALPKNGFPPSYVLYEDSVFRLIGTDGLLLPPVDLLGGPPDESYAPWAKSMHLP